MKTPPVPPNFSADAKKLWVKLLEEMGQWEDSQLLLIRTGLEQWDMLQKARKQIRKEGLTVADRFGQHKPHPLLPVVRDCAAGVRAMYKLLGLDFIEGDG